MELQGREVGVAREEGGGVDSKDTNEKRRRGAAQRFAFSPLEAEIFRGNDDGRTDAALLGVAARALNYRAPRR